jgi:hypothetical protein
MNTAPRTWWLWLQRTDSGKPWSGLELHVGQTSIALFHASVCITIGDGAFVLFWEDACVRGLMVEAIVPDILKLVRPALRKRRTVHDGLAGNSWVGAIT